MGRGRQKAKHTKVARELKYFSPDTDLSRLEQELGGNPRLAEDLEKWPEFETPGDAEFETSGDAEFETSGDAEFETSGDAENRASDDTVADDEDEAQSA